MLDSVAIYLAHPEQALVQLLTGLAGASSLFLVASGLSLIFGVTRIVNFAHGSLYMLGAFLAYTLTGALPRTFLGFWTGVIAAALVVAVIGLAIERVLLRRLYASPELFQLLATFGIVLIVQDVALMAWGAEELLGPRAPGLSGAVPILGQSFPQYELLIIAIGPLVLLALWLLLHRTRWGILVRAATQDREMTAALGVDQVVLFSSVFALGSFLAGIGGALQVPREAASLHMDLPTITEAFVVVVVGGMGSIAGAYMLTVLTECAVLALFAASLHFIMGPGGMASFGHAAYFGLGAYAAALATRHGWPMIPALAIAPAVALVGALVFG